MKQVKITDWLHKDYAPGAREGGGLLIGIPVYHDTVVFITQKTNEPLSSWLWMVLVSSEAPNAPLVASLTLSEEPLVTIYALVGHVTIIYRVYWNNVWLSQSTKYSICSLSFFSFFLELLLGIHASQNNDKPTIRISIVQSAHFSTLFDYLFDLWEF